MKRKKTMALITFFIVTMSTLADGNPTATVKGLINRFGAIMKSGAHQSSKEAQLKSLYFNSLNKTMLAQATMRKNWKKLDKQQQKSFADKFSTFIFHFYASKMDNYDPKTKVIVKDSKIKGKFAMVKTIVQIKSQNLALDYRLIKLGNSWKIFDVAVEGVRISRTYKSQFSDILSRGSYADLDKALDKLIAKYK